MATTHRSRRTPAVSTDSVVAWLCLGGVLLFGALPLLALLHLTGGLILGRPHPWIQIVGLLGTFIVAVGHVFAAFFSWGTYRARDELWLPVRLTIFYWGFATACLVLWPLAIAVRLVIDH